MWIHVPSTFLASARDMEALSLDSELLSRLAQSATWRTKSVSLASLRRVWKTVPSIRHLSGLTSEPLIQSLGVARWISSLEDSPASHTVSLETNSAKTIHENLVEKSFELPPDLDTQLSFWRTSPGSLDSTSITSDQAYKTWATRLRKDSTRRRKQAHLTSVNGSLSWRTPASQESGINPERLEGGLGSRMYDKETGRLAQYGLPQQVQHWPTPNAGPQNDSDTTWPQRREELKEKWGNNGFGLTLGMAATNWPTPAALSTPQAPTTMKDGHTCSPSCRSLNPLFAEMLMGLPQGWCNDSEPLETGSFQRWQHSLSESLHPNSKED